MPLLSTLFSNCDLETLFQARNKEDNTFAALKQVEIKNEEDLEDFSVEINILAECPHKNVVGLHEAFFFDNKLWVSLSYSSY